MIVPDYAVLLVFAVTLFVAVGVTALLTFGLLRADAALAAKRRFAVQVVLTVALWTAGALALAYSGALVPRAGAFPILGALIIGGAILGNVVLLSSATAKSVLSAIPAHWLASIQIYRLIGVVFLLLLADGLLPRYFAWTTGWGDILVGIAAPLVGYLLWRDVQRYAWVGLGWCAIGIADLILVLIKAVRSAPGPLQAAIYNPPTEIIGYFPFPMVPLVIVPMSLILHVQLIRALTMHATPVGKRTLTLN
ncbi:MAG: hypothetical protein AAGL96_06670 [Pseudomonadota bacterium]